MAGVTPEQLTKTTIQAGREALVAAIGRHRPDGHGPLALSAALFGAQTTWSTSAPRRARPAGEQVFAARLELHGDGARGRRGDRGHRIGSMAPDPGDIVGSVLEWLDTEARLRGVDVEPVTRFERLVFEEGQVIGAVFTTSDGLFAVRARHGVLLCRAGFPDRRASPAPEAADSVLGVALVSKAASRFGRVELLTSDPAVARAVGMPSVGSNMGEACR